MKIALVSPKSLGNTLVAFPHGILQIAAELKKHGYTCDIFDFNVTNHSSNDFLNKYDVVGLSVMSTQLRHAVEIVNGLNKTVKVIWGGVHCFLDPLSVVQKFPTHFVVSGEGEYPMLNLLKYFSGRENMEWLRGQNGICFYNDAPVINQPNFISDLNNLADVNYYDMQEIEKYIFKKQYWFDMKKDVPLLDVLVGRGCYWKCSFCINSLYRKHKAYHRSKSIDKIRRETENIIDDFNIRFVNPRDDDFYMDKKVVNDWKEYAKEKGFLWEANFRFNYFTEKQLDEQEIKNFIDSGLYVINMAIEAGVEDIRNSILKKKVTDADIFRAVERINHSVGKKVAVGTSFIIDFPGDTQANKIREIQWMDYLHKHLNILFSGPQKYRSYPGSDLYTQEKDHKSGDLDYYLNNITQSGEIKSYKKRSYYQAFYSPFIQLYYNRKFQSFKINDDSTWDVSPNIKNRIISSFVFELLFLPIKIRLMLNFWVLFWEPHVIGFIFTQLEKLSENSRKFFKRI
ncbi:cobalamin-dependent protein [candidate division KSB1 bacterium]|nr:cobalamin-dependent protein [candidate division KSB1 bacterium]